MSIREFVIALSSSLLLVYKLMVFNGKILSYSANLGLSLGLPLNFYYHLANKAEQMWTEKLALAYGFVYASAGEQYPLYG